ELGGVELQVVAQHVEQRGGGIGLHGLGAAVDLERGGHGVGGRVSCRARVRSGQGAWPAACWRSQLASTASCSSVSVPSNGGIQRPGRPATGSMPWRTMCSRLRGSGMYSATASGRRSALLDESPRPASWQVAQLSAYRRAPAEPSTGKGPCPRWLAAAARVWRSGPGAPITEVMY